MFYYIFFVKFIFFCIYFVVETLYYNLISLFTLFVYLLILLLIFHAFNFLKNFKEIKIVDYLGVIRIRVIIIVFNSLSNINKILCVNNCFCKRCRLLLPQKPPSTFVIINWFYRRVRIELEEVLWQRLLMASS